MSENVKKPSEILRPLFDAHSDGASERYSDAMFSILDSLHSRLTALEPKPEAVVEPNPEGEVTFTQIASDDDVYAYKGGKWCVCRGDGTFGVWCDGQRLPFETNLPRSEAERLRPAIATRFPVSDPYPHWHDAGNGHVVRVDSRTSGEWFDASGDREPATVYTINLCNSGHYPRITQARACELNPYVPKPDQATAKPVVPASREELRVGMTFEINKVHPQRTGDAEMMNAQSIQIARDAILANAYAIDKTGVRTTIEVDLDTLTRILQDHQRQDEVIESARKWLVCGSEVMDKFNVNWFGSALASVVAGRILTEPKP